MGRRGPPPTPTAILRQRGSHRANERPKEPTLVPGRPQCPQWLRGDARRAWKKLIPMLEAMGVLSRSDGNAIARYCDLLAQWREVRVWCDQNGTSYPIRKLNPETGELYVVGFKLFPQVRLANEYATLLLRLEREFGLTPSARARLAMGDMSDRPAKQKEDHVGPILRIAP